jgi:hypothetical protein
LLTQVHPALVHLVAEVSLQAVCFIAGAVVAVGTPALLEATDAPVTGNVVAERLRWLTASLGASLTGDAVQNLGLGRTAIGRDAVVRPTFTDPALTGDVVARIRLTGVALGAVGPRQTVAVFLTRRGVYTAPVAADAGVAVFIGSTRVLCLTTVFAAALESRNTVGLDRTEVPVGALSVVLITDPEITDDARAGVVVSTGRQTDCCSGEYGKKKKPPPGKGDTARLRLRIKCVCLHDDVLF